MSTAQQELPKAKKKRGARRNYERELRDIRAYCSVSKDILSEGGPLSDFSKGQVAAFDKVLARMEKSN